MVKFDSDVGSFSTFDDVAVSLLEMTGHSGTVPGAIDAGDVGQALRNLREQVAGLPEPGPENPDDEVDDSPPVSMSARAFALAQLLEDAHKNQSGIRWRSA